MLRCVPAAPSPPKRLQCPPPPRRATQNVMSPAPMRNGIGGTMIDVAKRRQMAEGSQALQMVRGRGGIGRLLGWLRWLRRARCLGWVRRRGCWRVAAATVHACAGQHQPRQFITGTRVCLPCRPPGPSWRPRRYCHPCRMLTWHRCLPRCRPLHMHACVSPRQHTPQLRQLQLAPGSRSMENEVRGGPGHIPCLTCRRALCAAAPPRTHPACRHTPTAAGPRHRGGPRARDGHGV